MISICLTTLLFASADLAPEAAAEPVEIRMIANMGVLIGRGHNQVLIDAIFTDVYDGRFRIPSESDLQDMAEGQGGFSEVDLLLFTHMHGDHFNAEEVAQVSTGVFVLGPDQVLDAVRAQGSDGVQVFDPGIDEPYVLAYSDTRPDGGDMRVEARPVYHMDEIENWAFAITFGETTVLHLGDANPDGADLSIWSDVDVDAVLYPVWFAMSDEGNALLEQFWPDALQVAVHVPAHVSREEAVEFFGDGHVLVDAGERITIHPGQYD